jgi:hypothetical protein
MKKDNNDAMKSDHQMQCIACGSNMEAFIERISDDRYGCPVYIRSRGACLAVI